jgi:hypothetical protein
MTRLYDLWLELRIQLAFWLFEHSVAQRRYALHLMTKLVNRRSPGQVARMERRKGLV